MYQEAELYKAALRVYTKPLFQWRKALATSSDGRTLYDLAGRGLRGLDELHRTLARREFHFRPALALHYNFNRRRRTLYLAPWEDRIVDLLLYRVMNRRLHRWFSPHSYAYRDHAYGLDACQARIAAVLRGAAAPLYLVKRDIADYFAAVDHGLLLGQLAQLAAPDDYLFALLAERIRFLFRDGDATRQAIVGIPFGTAAACLFANVHLTRLDREVAGIAGVHWFRYADDLLLLTPSRAAALAAAAQLESGIAALHLRTKASHRANLCLTPGGNAGDAAFAPAREFRHLGLLFRAGGEVALSRDKGRKLQNLFRFAFRRGRRRWARAATCEEKARALAGIAREVLERGVRNVAIVDYYLKHVSDEAQLRRLDRWLAEEVLSLVCGGHRKGHFGRISYSALRQMGLPSLRHRRRLLLRGSLASPFFIWRRQRAVRAMGRTVARPRRTMGAATAFSSLPEAAASACP